MLDEDGVIKMPDINFEPNPNGLGDELFKVMVKNGDKIAQVSSYQRNIKPVNLQHNFCRYELQMDFQKHIPPF